MMCVGLISVISCSSTANRWPGSNFLIVTNAQIISDTIFVLTFHILLTLISRSLYLPSFSVSFVQLLLWWCLLLILLLITFHQSTYNDIPGINHIYRESNVTDNLWLMLSVMLYSTFFLYFYINTSWSMCAVPSIYVFCSLLMLCFPSMSLRQFLIDSELVPAVPILLEYIIIIIFDNYIYNIY